MKLVFALVLAAVCIAGQAVAQTCLSPDSEFRASEEYTVSDSNQPPEDYPNDELKRALAEDKSISSLLKERQADASLQPEAASDGGADERSSKALKWPSWYCPWYYRHIWRISKQCWVVWPHVHYAVCWGKKTCTRCSGGKGYCRQDCYYRYKWVLVFCWKSWGQWYFQWRYQPFPALPQVCDCRRC